MGSRDSGSYIPTTQSWDVSEIYSTDVNSQQFKELIVRLYQNMNTSAVATNGKDTGMYDTQEFVNGQTYFASATTSSASTSQPTRRQVFRKVVNFGALPNSALKQVAHTITVTPTVTFTRIYGTASKPSTSFIPIPYSSAVANDNIELSIDATNVNITTSKDMSAWTTCYVVLEYLKL